MEIWCHYEPLIFVDNANTSAKSVKPLQDKTNATNKHCKNCCLFCQMFVFRRHWQNEKKVLEWSEIVAITTPCTQSTKSPISLIWSIADKNSVKKKTWKRSKPNGKIAYGMRIVNKNPLLFFAISTRWQSIHICHTCSSGAYVWQAYCIDFNWFLLWFFRVYERKRKEEKKRTECIGGKNA